MLLKFIIIFLFATSLGNFAQIWYINKLKKENRNLQDKIVLLERENQVCMDQLKQLTLKQDKIKRSYEKKINEFKQKLNQENQLYNQLTEDLQSNNECERAKKVLERIKRLELQGNLEKIANN